MIIGISGKKQSGKDTIAKIIQGLDWYYNGDKNNIREKYSDIEYTTKVINNEILQYSGWQIKKFADKLKQITSILIDCNIEDLENEKFKDKELGEEWWYIKQEVDRLLISYDKNNKILMNLIDNAHHKLIKPTPRLLLQLLGTECGRQIIHPDIWVNALFSSYRQEIFNYRSSLSTYKGIGHYKIDFHPSIPKEHWEKEISTRDFEWAEYKYPNWIITDCRFPNEAKAIKDRNGITIRVNRLIGKRVYIISNEQPFENWYGTVESYNYNGFYNVINNVDDVILVHKNQIMLQDEHSSETALDDYKFDYYIDNNGTIEELIEKVKEILISNSKS